MNHHDTRSLDGATALITGAGSGIGRATALALARHGMQVILVGRRLHQLNETAQAIRRNAGTALIRQCDLAESDDVARLASTVLNDSASGISVLVHSAAMYVRGSFEETTLQQFNDLIRTNVGAPFQLTGLLLSALRAARGDVVFVNSSSAIRSSAMTGPYSASKAALKALADSLRQEVNSQGVRVLSVFPGRVATPMQAAVCRHEGREYRPSTLLQPEDIARVIVNAVMLSTTAEIADIDIRPVL